MKNSTFRTNGSLFAFFTACTLLGCTSDPATAEMLDMSTGTDAGVVETPLVNASLYNTVLGRPTDSSIAISVLAAKAGDQVFVEYGTQIDATQSGLVGSQKSAAVASKSGEPIVLELTGLNKDTKYYYRVHYQVGGVGDAPDNIHTFRTQRAKGSTFHFGVQGDTHPERNNNKMFHSELFTLTMQEVRKRQPDLYFTLGDDFSIEKVIQDFKEANYPLGYSFLRSVEGVAPPLSPVGILSESLALFGNRLEQRGIRVELDLQAAQSARILGDRVRLGQIFTNLLENSARYTDANGTLRITAQLAQQQLVLRFDDSAPGVPDDALPHLFDRLYRTESSRSRAHGGSGLGLSICQRLVEAHGGTITARASPLGGLRMQIMMPLL